MADQQVAPVTTPVAPAAPPAAAKEASTPATRAERKEALLRDVKAAPADGGESKPAAPAPAPEERKAKQFADVANEHKKVLDAKAELKREQEAFAAQKKDADVAAALRKGDFAKLEDLLGADWYDKATMFTIGKNKPNAPEVIEAKLSERLAKQEAEIEALKNPKPKEPTAEEKAAHEAKVEADKSEFRGAAAELVKADARFTELQKESPEEVGAEIYDALDRRWAAEQAAAARALEKQGVPKAEALRRAIAESKPPTRADVEAAAVQLEAALRAQNGLTGKRDDGTNTSGNEHQLANQPQQSRSKSGVGKSETTLTAAMHETVPISGAPLTREQRKAKLVAQMRAARSTDD